MGAYDPKGVVLADGIVKIMQDTDDDPSQLHGAKRRKVCEGSAATCNEYSALLDDMANAGSKDDLLAAGFEVLEAGFANTVCAIERFGKELVCKQYTDLVFLRVDRQAVGAVDVHAGNHGVGPEVFYSGLCGLVAQRLPGRTLEECDMHKGDWCLLRRVASAVAALHRLPVPEECAGEPMLWRTIDKMLDVAAQHPELLPKRGVPSVNEIRLEVRHARSALAKHDVVTVLGHGDCKPSNVIATANSSDQAMLIDFELGGPNYRGFDLFKLFRTAKGFSEESLRYFLMHYLKHFDYDDNSGDADNLLAETRLFEPLTWLEAGIFFLTMPHFKPCETCRWHDLAVDRWEKYQRTKSALFVQK